MERSVLMENINDLAVKAATDEATFTVFLESQRRFIINCAYRTTHKFITVSDDEWSIALIAFSNAVKTYDKEKGNFLPFAEIIIKRQLIDYYRSIKKFHPEFIVNPNLFESNSENEETDASIKTEVTEKLLHAPNDSMKYEIEAANETFREFGFSFFSLAECSPKSAKTKAACRQAVLSILHTPALLEEIYQSKQLPIKKIQKITKLPRKLLEHHRRYIIAALVILSGEYPLLAEYMSFIRKEGN